MRREVRDIWIGTLLLSLAIYLPVVLSSEDPVIQYGLVLISQLVFLLYFGRILGRAGYFSKERNEVNTKHLLILLPICISLLPPIISLCLYPDFVNSYCELFNTAEIDMTPTLLSYACMIVSAITDEMFFRMIIYERIPNKYSRLMKVLISAGIFALFELIGFFQTFNIFSTLIDMLVAFVLGLFLGFLREYTHSIWPCMIFHVLNVICFNILPAPISADIVMVYIGLPILAIIYLVIVYFAYFKEKEDVNNVC